MAELDLLLEAEKRGILPESKKPFLDEARKRGLVPSAKPETFGEKLKGFRESIDPYEFIKGVGERGTALGRGLVSETFGLPGAIEQIARYDIPEYFGAKPTPEEKQKTLLPQAEQISAFLSEGQKEKYPTYEAVGGYLPALVGGAGLIKSGIEAVTPLATRAYRAVLGRGAEEARKGLESEVLKETRAAQAGYTPQAEAEAQAGLASAQQAKQAAEQAASAVETQLSQTQGISPEKFVNITRNTATKLENALIDAREKGAGFGKAIEDAGNELKVDTTEVVDLIDNLQSQLRNPQFNAVANQVKRLAVNETGVEGEEAIKALSVGQADSLRKTIDNAIRSRKLGDAAIDKETAYHLKNLRKILVKAATDADEGYKTALGKFNTLSRPLDIFSKGELGKITEQADRTAGGFAAREAEVIGILLNRGGDSARLIERLQQANPDIRNAVKLYFSRQLFGEGGTPTVNAMRSFLLKNESVLRRLNLYDDFATIRNSIKTAKDAVTQATEAEKIAEAGVKGVSRAADIAKEARQAELMILNADRKQAASVTRQFIKQLHDANRITDDRFADLLRQVDRLERSTESEANIRKALLGAAGLTGVGALGYLAKATKIVPPLFGGD